MNSTTKSPKITTVINFLGGPGTCKSTFTSGIFAEFKRRGLDCEMSMEYAKGQIYDDSINKLNNQIYIFGKQHHSLWRLCGKVDMIITDSPLLLSIIYDSKNNETFRKLVLEEFSKFNNINILIERDDSMFKQSGRLQDLPKSKEIDNRIREILEANKFPYVNIKASDSIENVASIILK